MTIEMDMIRPLVLEVCVCMRQIDTCELCIEFTNFVLYIDYSSARTDPYKAKRRSCHENARLTIKKHITLKAGCVPNCLIQTLHQGYNFCLLYWHASACIGQKTECDMIFWPDGHEIVQICRITNLSGFLMPMHFTNF